MPEYSDRATSDSELVFRVLVGGVLIPFKAATADEESMQRRVAERADGVIAKLKEKFPNIDEKRLLVLSVIEIAEELVNLESRRSDIGLTNKIEELINDIDRKLADM